MSVREIKPGILAVGAIDWDRRLFDELIPLPDGTSYNSYVIKGSEKTVLIDTVDPTKKDVLLENLNDAGVKRLDYIVSHHGEQDHSGAIPDVLRAYQGAKVLANSKCMSELIDLMDVEESDFFVVKDKQEVSLGDKTLQFTFTPWVHWPETSVTHLKEDNILFTCDFFGAHFASSELFARKRSGLHPAAKRYYAEIMMPFKRHVKTNIEKVKEIGPSVIAPSHGPVYQDPSAIIESYEDWTSDDVKNTVVIPYVSMHGSTTAMVEYLTQALIDRGIEVKPFHLTATDIGDLAMALVDAATIVVGSPTVLGGAHPQAVYAAILANALKPKARFLSVIGSYGWGGKMVEQLGFVTSNLKVEVIEPVIAKGYPREADLRALDRLADDIRAKHADAGCLPS